MGHNARQLLTDKLKRAYFLFGFEPEEYQYVTSPFTVESGLRHKNDTSPGCWFEEYDGKLRFKDFANYTVWKGISLKNMDCFDMVQVYFQLHNFYDTLRFIESKLINEDSSFILDKSKHETAIKPIKTKKKPAKVYAMTREWQIRDKEYWQDRYLITKQQLIKDKVFPITKFKIDIEFKLSHV